ncbi:MAG: hypothetical protein QG656_668 [Candidatus Hydrogenedentes bacterium]|nr:hypothetical protein [Candidatus Hydrogenedentota bacterium]
MRSICSSRSSISVFLACLALLCAGGCTPLEDTAGFIELGPVDYTVKNDTARLDLQSSRARFWHIFQIADEDPENKPLAIFFNGGPGSSSMDLFSANTARNTLDPSRNGNLPVGPNPASWTSIANLLYIDARDTGFSYMLNGNAAIDAVRDAEFGVQNFNPYLDAADFIRVLLRFYEDHPQLRDNPVYIVGESYGGIRATVMLHLILHYKEYGDGSRFYQDPALAEALQEHFEQVFWRYRGKTVPPDVIARQFSHQVLIQPLLSTHQAEVMADMYEEPGSIVYQIAAETGTTYVPLAEGSYFEDVYNNAMGFLYDTAHRDLYWYPYPSDLLFDTIDVWSSALLNPDHLATAIGVDPKEIEGLYATERTEAYRRPAHPVTEEKSSRRWWRMLSPRARNAWTKGAEIPEDALIEVFGTLQPWDEYFMPVSDDVFLTFDANQGIEQGLVELDYWRNDVFGEMFLENVLSVETFITAASLDLVLYAPALPPALARYTDIVESSAWDKSEPADVARPGLILVDYHENAFPELGVVGSRAIRYPTYAEGPHAVSAMQPEDLLYDVTEWIASTENDD